MLSTENRNILKSLSIYKQVSFEFNDGWTNMIYTLGKNIELYSTLHNIPLIEVKQIKEKFSSLRFYYIGSDDEYIRALVRQAEEQSETICEICGNSGQSFVQDGRWYTACEEHRLPDSMTVPEFKVKQEARAKEMRKCDICGKKGSVGYWTGSKHVSRCINHKEEFITSDEYFIKWEREIKNVNKNN
jgi:hypothetical protein